MEKHERLRKARQARKLVQEALALAGEIKQSQLSRMERGEVWGSNDVLQRLAKKLEIPIDSLLDIDISQPCKRSERTDNAKSISINESLPNGLRDLARDSKLTSCVSITGEEWHFLASLQLPYPSNKDGYLALLFVMRGVVDN